jgi:protein SCO1/2
MKIAVLRHVLASSLLAGLVAICFCGCSRAPAPKRYEVHGRVVGVDAAARELTIASDEIPGYMEAMTMPYQVGKSDESVFRNIAPGDDIRGTLVVTDHAELQEISFTKPQGASTSGTSQMHIPQPGEDVPDITLTNQSGRAIHLNRFRGKPLLLTFIYTRCPFPDYCLRMSNNFAQVLEQLQRDPKKFAQAQLLSISIDPEHDTPAALRSYGEHYVGRLDPKFQRWEFACGTPDQVRKAADFFGLAYNTKDGQIVHNLSTVLIGKDGKVVKVYSGNDWKPDQVAADVAVASSSG